MYEGHDDFEPVRSAFQTLDLQLKDLQVCGLRCGGRVFQVSFFLSADIPALQCCLGLSVNGTCFCPFCTIKQDNLDHQSLMMPAFPKRTLSGMQESLKEFHKLGGSLDNRKAANLNANVIIPPLFPSIPIENVSIPELHISLGVFKRFADLEEDLLTEVDLWRQDRVESRSAAVSAHLGTFRNLLGEREAVELDRKLLLMEIEELQGLRVIACADDPGPDYLQQLDLRLGAKQDALQNTVFELEALSRECAKALKKVPRGDSTLIKAFETALNSLGIEKQSYHSQCYVGNDVQRGFKGRSQLFGLLQNDSDCFPGARERERKLLQTVEAFHAVREIYTLNRPLNEEEIQSLERGVQQFQLLYTERFGNLTPKMHILSHMASFSRRHGSIGIFTEQGIESVHPFVMLTNGGTATLRTREAFCKLSCAISSSQTFQEVRDPSLRCMLINLFRSQR